MRGAVELLFSPEAGDVLDELGQDASNDTLVDAIWDALELISEHPGSAQARHRGLRTAGGNPVWLVPVRGQYQTSSISPDCGSRKRSLVRVQSAPGGASRGWRL